VQNFLLEKNSKNCDWSEETLSFDSGIIGNDETSCTLNINEPKLFKLQIVSIILLNYFSNYIFRLENSAGDQF